MLPRRPANFGGRVGGLGMTTFKPCPLCAAPITQAHHVNQGMGGFTYVIRCPCGLMFDTGALSEEAAAQVWNEEAARC